MWQDIVKTHQSKRYRNFKGFKYIPPLVLLHVQVEPLALQHQGPRGKVSLPSQVELVAATVRPVHPLLVPPLLVLLAPLLSLANRPLSPLSPSSFEFARQLSSSPDPGPEQPWQSLSDKQLRQISVRNVTKIYIWPHLLLLWKSIATEKPGTLKDVLHGAEVELNLFLDAQLRPAWFWPSRSTWWASWPHRAPQYNIERATSDNGVPGDVNGQEGGHLVARVKQVLVLVLVLEPLAGHCVIRDNTGLYWKIPSQWISVLVNTSLRRKIKLQNRILYALAYMHLHWRPIFTNTNWESSAQLSALNFFFILAQLRPNEIVLSKGNCIVFDNQDNRWWCKNSGWMSWHLTTNHNH